MKPFAYARAGSVADAVQTVSRSGAARFLGGGTNLVDLMRLEVETPELLVDVNRLALHGVEDLPGGGLTMGASARNSVLAAHPSLRARYPAVAEALLAGASGQLRNAATTAGNLLQRTRCPYFQDVTKPCNKRVPGTGCPAREGEHRNLAVVGHSDHCVATHPSDFAVPLAAFDALVRVTGPTGERVIPLTELHRLPGDTPELDTVLEPGELIVAVDLPPLRVAARSTYRKVRERASFAFALVSVAAALEVADGRITDARIAFGGLAHKPWRARLAEEALRGALVDEAAFRAAAERELAQAEPLRDNAYKVPLACNTLVDVLLELAA